MLPSWFEEASDNAHRFGFLYFRQGGGELCLFRRQLTISAHNDSISTVDFSSASSRTSLMASGFLDMCMPLLVLGRSTNASKVGIRTMGLFPNLSIFKSFLTPVTPTRVRCTGMVGVLSWVSGKHTRSNFFHPMVRDFLLKLILLNFNLLIVL